MTIVRSNNMRIDKNVVIMGSRRDYGRRRCVCRRQCPEHIQQLLLVRPSDSHLQTDSFETKLLDWGWGGLFCGEIR